MAETETVIRVEDLRMRYGSVDVLDEVGFTVRRGEVVTLLGPNGAGKTTTIEILEGFRVRSAGDVSVLGVDPIDAPRGLASARGDRAPVVAGSRPLDAARAAHPPGPVLRAVLRARPAATVRRRAAALAGRARGAGRSEDPDALRRAAAAARCGGRDRRAAGAAVPRRADRRASTPRPGGTSTGWSAGSWIEEDTTILLTTHDLDEAERLADRILILAGGRIVADGSADELASSVTPRGRGAVASRR